MDRSDLIHLCQMHRRAARLLLTQGHYAEAYYLTGVAAECALKACIAKARRRYEFPDKKLANDSFTHDLDALVKTAGLTNSLQSKKHAEPKFALNWAVLAQWRVDKRYDHQTSRDEAASLYSAFVGRNHGVLTWIRQNW